MVWKLSGFFVLLFINLSLSKKGYDKEILVLINGNHHSLLLANLSGVNSIIFRPTAFGNDIPVDQVLFNRSLYENLTPQNTSYNYVDNNEIVINTRYYINFVNGSLNFTIMFADRDHVGEYVIIYTDGTEQRITAILINYIAFKNLKCSHKSYNIWIGYTGDNFTKFFIEYNYRDDINLNNYSRSVPCFSNLPSIFLCHYNSSNIDLYDYKEINVFVNNQINTLLLKRFSCYNRFASHYLRCKHYKNINFLEKYFFHWTSLNDIFISLDVQNSTYDCHNNLPIFIWTIILFLLIFLVSIITVIFSSDALCAKMLRERKKT